MTTPGGFFVEAILSFVIGFVFFSSVAATRRASVSLQPLAALPIGLVYFAAIALAANLTGGCFNPARAFVPLSLTVSICLILLKGPVRCFRQLESASAVLGGAHRRLRGRGPLPASLS